MARVELCFDLAKALKGRKGILQLFGGEVEAVRQMDRSFLLQCETNEELMEAHQPRQQSVTETLLINYISFNKCENLACFGQRGRVVKAVDC